MSGTPDLRQEDLQIILDEQSLMAQVNGFVATTLMSSAIRLRREARLSRREAGFHRGELERLEAHAASREDGADQLEAAALRLTENAPQPA